MLDQVNRTQIHLHNPSINSLVSQPAASEKEHVIKTLYIIEALPKTIRFFPEKVSLGSNSFSTYQKASIWAQLCNSKCTTSIWFGCRDIQKSSSLALVSLVCRTEAQISESPNKQSSAIGHSGEKRFSRRRRQSTLSSHGQFSLWCCVNSMLAFSYL